MRWYKVICATLGAGLALSFSGLSMAVTLEGGLTSGVENTIEDQDREAFIDNGPLGSSPGISEKERLNRKNCGSCCQHINKIEEYLIVQHLERHSRIECIMIKLEAQRFGLLGEARTYPSRPKFTINPTIGLLAKSYEAIDFLELYDGAFHPGDFRN